MHKTTTENKSTKQNRTAQKFEIEISDPSKTTILQCKKLAIEGQPQLGAETDFLVIVHKGQVLEDEKTVSEAEITEDGFVVVMSKKTKKPAEKKPAKPLEDWPEYDPEL